MKLGQFALDGNQSLEQNKEFFRRLYLTKKIEDKYRWFDKITEEDVRRVPDQRMNLNNYLSQMDDSYFIRLQIGDPYPENEVRYCIRGRDFERTTRFAWITCPLNENNYSVVEDIFNDVFKQKLEDIKRL